MIETTLIDVLVVFCLSLLAFFISRSYFDSDIRVTGILIIIFIAIMVFLDFLSDFFYTIAILLLATIIYSLIKKGGD